MLSASQEVAIELDFSKSNTREYMNKSLDGESARNGVGVAWKDLRYSVPQKKGSDKEIIHGVTGLCKPGQFVAILGGSGAGKSTLLDILAGRKTTGKITGDLTFNGTPMSELGQVMKRITAYVTQEDIFLPSTTVQENLRFYAKLTMGGTTAEQHAAVEHLMEELNISHLKSSRIGGVGNDKRGISGGEKKRVAIAEQLLRNPAVLYLDEPTSGLDAFNSQQVMELLRRLAETRKMSIICSIHQPRSSIYEMFDQILILKNGRAAFFGAADHAAPYFENLGHSLVLGYNPADFFIDVVLAKESDQDFAALYDASNLSSAMRAEVEEVQKSQHLLSGTSDTNYYAVSYATQLHGLLQRWGRDLFRNPEDSTIVLGQGIFMGLLVGSIFFKLDATAAFARAGLLFLTLLSGTFPITSVAVSIVQKRAITNRERSSGVYHIVPLWLARTLLDFPVHIVFPILFTSIMYFMTGLNASASRFFTFIAIAILNCMIAGSLYTLIGAALPDALTANVMSFVITVILMLFGGFFVVVPTYWVWMQYVSFINWSWKAAMINEFEGTPGGDAVLAQFDLAGWSLWSPFVGLICQLIIYRGLALLAMTFLHREKR